MACQRLLLAVVMPRRLRAPAVAVADRCMAETMTSASMARSAIMAIPILPRATIEATADRPSSSIGSAKNLNTTPSNIAGPNRVKTKRLMSASSLRFALRRE